MNADRDRIQDFFSRIHLTDRQAEAFMRIVCNGESLKFAAQEMGISRQAVLGHATYAQLKLSRPWVKPIAEELLAD